MTPDIDLSNAKPSLVSKTISAYHSYNPSNLPGNVVSSAILGVGVLAAQKDKHTIGLYNNGPYLLVTVFLRNLLSLISSCYVHCRFTF